MKGRQCPDLGGNRVRVYISERYLDKILAVLQGSITCVRTLLFLLP